MREWNDNFDEKRNIDGNVITVGEQNFEDSTIAVKEEDGTIHDCPMGINKNGDIYFLYNRMVVFVSEYLGWYPAEDYNRLVKEGFFN